MDVKQILTNVGNELYGVISTDAALYGIYFIAFFIGIYALTNNLLQKLPQFKGKAAKTISFMVTVITTGAIFYGTGSRGRPVHDLLILFNGFGGFLFILFLSVSFMLAGVYLYKKNKDTDKNLALFYVFLFLFIGSSLLMPQFPHSETKESGWTYNSDGDTELLYETIMNRDGYVAKRTAKAFDVIGATLDWVRIVSMLGLIWMTFKLMSGLFKGDESTSHLSGVVKESEDEEVDKEIVNSTIRNMKEFENNMNQGAEIFNKQSKSITDLNRLINGGSF